MADSTVIALIFEDEKGADRLLDTIEETLILELFPIDDAAVAVYKQDGAVVVKQWAHPLSDNGFSPQLWEFLIKTLLSGWGLHIDDWPIEAFKRVFLPGTSVFFSLIEPYASRDVILLFREYNGTLIYSGLTEEQKVLLKAAASHQAHS